jgi:hypothetical protein
MNTKEKILIVAVIEKKNPPINSSSIVYAQIEGFSVYLSFCLIYPSQWIYPTVQM